MFALAVLLMALTLTPSLTAGGPTGAEPSTPPPSGSIVVPYGNVPRFCVDGEPGATSPNGTHRGVAWSPLSQRWVSVPICTFRWGYISMSPAAQVIRAGGVATFSLTDSAAAPYIPTLGGAWWSGFSAGQVVSGCTTYDVTCSIRFGVDGQDPPEWSYHEIHLSAPSSFVTWFPQFGCTEESPCPYLPTNVWGTVVVSPAPSEGPTASFTAQVEPTGRTTLTSTSSDPYGDELIHEWDVGDGQWVGLDSAVTVAYERPGTYVVRLTVHNERTGLSDTTTREIHVPAPTLDLTIDLPDDLGALEPADRVVQLDDPIVIGVTVASSAEGVGALEGVRFFADGLLEVRSGVASMSGPEPVPPSGGLTLRPGEQERFLVEIRPSTVGELVLVGQVTGSDAAGGAVDATAETRLTVATPISVELTAEPARLERPGPSDAPVPEQEFTVSVHLRNDAPVRLTAAQVVRIGSPGWDHIVRWVGDAENPGPWSLAPGEEVTTRFRMRASEVHPFELVAEAQATLPTGTVVSASGRTALGVSDPQPLFVEVAPVPASSPVNTTFPVYVWVGNPSDAIAPVEGVSVDLWSVDGANAEVVERPSGVDSMFSLAPGEWRSVTVQVRVTDRGLSSLDAVAVGRRRGLSVSGDQRFETIARIPTSISVEGVRRRTAAEIAPGTDDQAFPWLVAVRLPRPGSCTGLDVSFTVVRDGRADPARALLDDLDTCRFLVPVADLEPFDLSATIMVTQQLRSGPRTVQIGAAMAKVTPRDAVGDDAGVISTVTTAGAVAGARRIEIASSSGWTAGDYARLHTPGRTVVRRVAAVGSLIFDAPLPVDVPAGTVVEKVDAPGGDVDPPSVVSSAGIVPLGSDAAVEFSCDDGDGVGVEVCVGSVASGTTLDTASPGTFDVTIETWDHNGNAHAVTVRYEVTSGTGPDTGTGPDPTAPDPTAPDPTMPDPTTPDPTEPDPASGSPGPDAVAPPPGSARPSPAASPALPVTGTGQRPAILASTLLLTGVSMTWLGRRRVLDSRRR